MKSDNSLNLIENDHLMNNVFYSQEFSPAECQRILEIPPRAELDQLWHDELKRHLPLELKLAQCRRRLIPYDATNEWLFQKLSNIVHTINEATYKFEIEQLAGTQIVEFEAGQSYPWHVDLGDHHFSLRKLGLILFLDDFESYQGGFLQMGSGAIKDQDQLQGSFCIYPAYIMKRFTPLESGRMRALLTWGVGSRPFH